MLTRILAILVIFVASPELLFAANDLAEVSASQTEGVEAPEAATGAPAEGGGESTPVPDVAPNREVDPASTLTQMDSRPEDKSEAELKKIGELWFLTWCCIIVASMFFIISIYTFLNFQQATKILGAFMDQLKTLRAETETANGPPAAPEIKASPESGNETHTN
ncbi:MAG: hypothetical protein NUW37_00380 [Planctomycetes bacterium]|nr:hypothetical protein [Planctomycetota bacterium]